MLQFSFLLFYLLNNRVEKGLVLSSGRDMTGEGCHSADSKTTPGSPLTRFPPDGFSPPQGRETQDPDLPSSGFEFLGPASVVPRS